MGVPMAPNYVYLFMDSFEQNLLHDYSEKTGLSPLVWFRFIDDIFFTWTGNKESLDHSIFFTQNYRKSKNMKSKIKFEIHLSTNEIHFLDSFFNSFFKTWKIKDNTAKPADSHFYLNTSSCYPSHVLKSVPKGQFIRLQHICL